MRCIPRIPRFVVRRAHARRPREGGAEARSAQSAIAASARSCPSSLRRPGFFSTSESSSSTCLAWPVRVCVCVDDIWMIKSVRNIASRAAVLSRKATTKCVVRDRCVRDLLSQSAGRPTLAYYVYGARYKVRRPTDNTTKSVTGVPACCCGLADFH